MEAPIQSFSRGRPEKGAPVQIGGTGEGKREKAKADVNRPACLRRLVLLNESTLEEDVGSSLVHWKQRVPDAIDPAGVRQIVVESSLNMGNES